ncbi:hypothetical protein VNG_0836H [Halobacterium salinarum NRC-1]|uniref:Uncharacterized protein n=2 Tax=Halobacterium salinarum NRC-34001 TaxID=2886895 RepID=Q9HR68_HALSA|nr:hypothetical protein VNG_0836H [Halobacterium salinarum NRC-1]CAP13561.1 uncharacterized protein OE_2234F [Halobacterium salinarum R1]DAC77996.1 TPA_inf: uncharacterized protein VNG_0836H [Halobacterium salinarum NRC-1]
MRNLRCADVGREHRLAEHSHRLAIVVLLLQGCTTALQDCVIRVFPTQRDRTKERRGETVREILWLTPTVFCVDLSNVVKRKILIRCVDSPRERHGKLHPYYEEHRQDDQPAVCVTRSLRPPTSETA